MIGKIVINASQRNVNLKVLEGRHGTKRVAKAVSSKIVKNTTLKVYTGAPHGMCTTLKHEVNEDLLAFIKA